jgi:large subunit ribosomal protein L9
MKVLFLKNVVNVWKAWEIKEVKDWYAWNFLLPKWFAKRLTPEDEKKLQSDKKKEENHRIQIIEQRHKIVETISWSEFIFKMKVGENWKAFWSVSEKDIIEASDKKLSIKLQKSNIDIVDWHLKKLWSKFVYIKLAEDSIAKITIKAE